MEKQSLSNDVQERYLDATLAAFMEEYVSVMDTGAEQNNGEFPQELDARCRKIIENARKQRRRNQMLRSFMRVCRSAAVLLVVLMCVGTTLFFTVESFRLPVINLIFERMENYTQISSKHTTVMSKTVGMDVDLNDPLKLVLEGAFQLTDIQNNWDNGQLIAQYESPDAKVIFFVEDYSGVLQIDTEDSVVTTPVIMNYEVIMAQKGDRYIIVWADEQTGRAYELCTYGFSELDAVDLCAQTIILFDAE